jgi:hypothetical protein
MDGTTMNKPTRWEIMRRNRPKLVKASESMVQRIDRIEREITEEWDTIAADDLRMLEEALARAREQSLRRSSPSLARRLLNWTMGMGARAHG